MRRYQLFEFLDQAWLPKGLREAATRYLTAAYATTPFPALWAGMLVRTLNETGLHRVIDIGSGSGGPMEMVMAEMAKLGCKAQVTLTDLFPVKTTSKMDYWPVPVSATCVPGELQGVRTLFETFHHFNPATARAVLMDAYTQRQAICIFEATSRTASALAFTILIPVMILVLTPRIRPLTFIQLFFTYLLPVFPLPALWDGFVSHLRTYSAEELQELTAGCSSADFRWESGVIEAAGVPYETSYLIGRPASA